MNFFLLYTIFAVQLSLLSFCNCNENFVNWDTNCSVVIDARSRETVLTVYGYNKTETGKLKTYEIYHNTTIPGIVILAPLPDMVIDILRNLIEEAKRYIPEGKLSQTPLQLIATDVALFSSKTVNILLKKIRKYFETTGFKVDSQSVFKMKGNMKYYDWIGVNLLLGRFEKNFSIPPAWIIDCGYTSSHAAFVKFGELNKWQENRVVNWTILNRTYSVYGDSIENSGAHEVRAKIIEQGKEESSETYKTPCLHPLAKTTWLHNLKTYQVQGEGNKTVNLTKCLEAVKNALKGFRSTPKMFAQEVYGLSFIHHAAVESKMTTADQNKNATLQEIRDTMKQVCMVYVLGKPFLCMDMAYIYLLLRKIFGLRNESRIMMTAKLDGVNVSWAVGAAFYKYQEYITWRSLSFQSIQKLQATT